METTAIHRQRTTAFVKFKTRLPFNMLPRPNNGFPANRQAYCVTGEAGWCSLPFEEMSMAVIEKARLSSKQSVRGLS